MSLPPPTHDSGRATVERWLNPTYGWCLRCGRPSCCVKDHVTDYNNGHGLFPLCEGCWTLLGHPEARIPYYKTLVDHWVSEGSPKSPDDLADIARAVAAGL